MRYIDKLLAYIKLPVVIIGLALTVLVLHIEGFILGFTEARGFKYRLAFIKFLIAVLSIKIHKTGDSSFRNALYACNHRMMIDPVVLLRYIDAYVVSKAEVADYPIIGSGTRRTNVVFLHRQDKDSRREMRRIIGELLESGKAVSIYPEGSVNLLDLSGPMFPGSFEVAASTGRPVVPVALDFADRSVYWGANSSLIAHFLDVFSRRRIICSIHYCEPIYSDNAEILKEQCQSAIDAALQQMRSEWSSK